MASNTKRIRIVRDDVPPNPREDDNLSHIVTWHNRYKLGDEQPSCTPEEYLSDLPKGSKIFPLFMYDHSGLVLSLLPFTDPWDSGQLGYVVVTPKQQATIGTPDDLIEECVRAEIDVYSAYIAGDVWGYVVEEETCCDTCDHSEWEALDSCWGFYGQDPEENGMSSYLSSRELQSAIREWE